MAVTEQEIEVRETTDQQGRRVLLATSASEWNALAHFRGWCHDMSKCPVCETQASHRAWGRREAVTSIAEGTS